MECSKTILFYEKCRLCLMNAGECNIFEREGFERDLHIYIGVKVSPTDNLPQKICHDCNEIVTNVLQLREHAMKNDTYLRTLFDVNDDEPTSADVNNLLVNSFSESQPVDTSVDQKCENVRVPSSVKEESILKGEQNDTLKVRTDLMAATSSPMVKVKTKEEYESVKKQIYQENHSFGEVVYECDMCRKSFPTWKKLYLHRRMHNKNIACPLDACGKKFATKGDLEKHIRTHTGYKPFSCDICDKSFAQQGTLKAHRETVHYSFTI